MGTVRLSDVEPAGSVFPRHLDSGVHVLQFRVPITAQIRDAVESVGAVVGYVPESAFLVRVAAATIVSPIDLPYLVWAGPLPEAYRWSPELLPGTRQAVRVNLVPGADLNRLPSPLEGRRGGQDIVFLETDAAVLRQLARHTDVLFLEPDREPALALEKAARYVANRQGQDGTYANDGKSMWSWNGSAFEGFTGSSLTVGISEPSFLDCNHADLVGRVSKVISYNGTNPCSYTLGSCNALGVDGCKRKHGTFASGAALGNGANSTGRLHIGAAPTASLVFTNGDDDNIDEHCRDVYAEGARVISWSWLLPQVGYSGLDVDADECVRDASNATGSQQVPVFVAVGNNGPTTSTVMAPATAKNVIAVGMAMTRDVAGEISPSLVNSRGPTVDGRFKPELIAPAHDIHLPEPGTANYPAVSGTSFASPLAAGTAGLVQRYYAENYSLNLTPAGLKALLIASAEPTCIKHGTIVNRLNFPVWCQPRDDTGQMGINIGGWGRINASRALFDSGSYKRLLVNDAVSLDTYNVYEYRFNVSSEQPLRVAVVWSDPPGTAGSNTPLVNQLDAYLVRDDDNWDTIWHANNFKDDSLESKNLTDAVGANDTKNVVEGFYIENPTAGTYRLRIRATNVPSGPQAVSVAVTGNVTYDGSRKAVFADHFTYCPFGLVHGYWGWEATATAPDVATCDGVPAWYLFLASDDTLLANYASAWHSIPTMSGGYVAESVVSVADWGTGNSKPFALLEAEGKVKFVVDAGDFKLDVTNGTGLAQDVYTLTPDHSYVLRATVPSLASTTYTAQVIDQNLGSVLFSGTYSVQATGAPSKLYLGHHTGPGDDFGASFYLVGLWEL